MSRPKPTILLTHLVGDKIEQILAADDLYGVYYNGKPVNIKTISVHNSIMAPKYKKSSFSNPGHAFNLANRLNKSFKTTAFTVHRMSDGAEIHE